MTVGGATGAVPAVLPDRIELARPGDVTLRGFLAVRVRANEAHLASVDLEPMLAGFEARPGSHPWIGEHIGKWLDAASLAWEHSRDERIRSKLDGAVQRLLATQDADGYLGTYPQDRRFGLYAGADWDVWVHSYVLTGLLAYHRVTGDNAALAACRRVGDLLDRTFRTGPDARRIIDAGTHVGMAATSVLEPMVHLYRATGEERYLDLAWSVVAAWDAPGGPRVLTTLRETGRVQQVGNGKAYEMLVNLIGLCELARATGERSLLDPVVAGWEDIVANHRYITGGASFAEHFHRPHELPNPMSPNVAETCVTVTWLQLNLHLLRLLGEARFVDEAERAAYNHLAAAQYPDGDTWCYYTALEGTKPYGPGISCCVSSGPRGIALLPTLLVGVQGNTVIVDLYEPWTATLSVAGRRIVATLNTQAPFTGGAELLIEGGEDVPVGLRLRIPPWAEGLRVREGSETAPAARETGWLDIPPRRYEPNEPVRLEFEPRLNRVPGEHGNAGKVALSYGPFVLSYGIDADSGHRTTAFDVLRETPAPAVAAWALESQRVVVTAAIDNRVDGLAAEPVAFVPFAEAGADGRPYRTWVATAEPDPPVSLLAGGVETRSSGTIEHGSAIDYEPYSFVSTYDGCDHPEEWVAVTLEEPVLIGRIVVGHGWSWVNGGWFDTSDGKPVIEIRTDHDAAWTPVEVLAAYPSTTAADPGGLIGGEIFEVVLPEPVRAVAVRVRGRGSSGAYPPQRYVTCGLLEAFER